MEGRLAACAQVSGPIASTYWWRGGIERADEWLCALKTSRGRLAALETELRARHPYELPEITVAPLDGSPDYLQWIADTTGPERRA